MKKLTKSESIERAGYIEKLEAAEKAITGATAVVNHHIQILNGKIDEYNEIVSKVESFRDDLVAEMESYIDDKSEKWPDSDSGQNYISWKDSWADYDVAPLDNETELTDPTMNHRTELEELNEEPD